MRRRCEECGASTTEAVVLRAGLVFCSQNCGEAYFCTPEEATIRELRAEIAKLRARIAELEAP